MTVEEGTTTIDTTLPVDSQSITEQTPDEAPTDIPNQLSDVASSNVQEEVSKSEDSKEQSTAPVLSQPDCTSVFALQGKPNNISKLLLYLK